MINNVSVEPPVKRNAKIRIYLCKLIEGSDLPAIDYVEAKVGNVDPVCGTMSLVITKIITASIDSVLVPGSVVHGISFCLNKFTLV